jgi:hypothetical protein
MFGVEILESFSVASSNLLSADLPIGGEKIILRSCEYRFEKLIAGLTLEFEVVHLIYSMAADSPGGNCRRATMVEVQAVCYRFNQLGRVRAIVVVFAMLRKLAQDLGELADLRLRDALEVVFSGHVLL